MILNELLKDHVFILATVGCLVLATVECLATVGCFTRK